MKMIIAVIQPQQLPAVKRALFAAQVFHMTATNILGTAPEREEHHRFRGVDQEVTLFQKVRLEIAVNEAFVQPTVDAIIDGSRATGGAGKIFVLELGDCIVCRTGERGPRAIG
ncbi:MAG: P-II family nitrogen regulator [Planctomycetota bacterium]